MVKRKVCCMDTLVEILRDKVGGIPTILVLAFLGLVAFAIFAFSPLEIVVGKSNGSWHVRIRRKIKR